MKKIRNLMKAFALAAGMSLVSGTALSAGTSDAPKEPTAYIKVSPDREGALYTTAADAPGTYTIDQAKQYCASLNIKGRQEWRLPNLAELNVLFDTRAAIGGFKEIGPREWGWYWSSSMDSTSKRPLAKSFSRDQSGTENHIYDVIADSPISANRLRCVRN